MIFSIKSRGDQKEHHIEIHFRISIINDKIQIDRNKDGSISRDKKGLRKYKVIEG